MNLSQETIDYRQALEALRNGVPNRDAVAVLGSNQRTAEGRFTERLSSVADLAKEGKQAPGLLVSGDFGSGKSHLLDYFEHLAHTRNFVCSRVVISKETPLFDPAKMFLAAVDSARVPGLSGEAIREISMRLQANGAAHAQLLKWTQTQGSGFSDLFKATVALHAGLNSDSELVSEITNFWSGERLAIPRIKEGLRQIGLAKAYSVKAIKVKELALERFLFASRLILAAGYSGWVLLIDEVELVGRYSRLQRGRSYAELARWMGRVESEVYPGLTTVAAITADFAPAVLQEKSDRDILGVKLREKKTDEYITMAGRAETGMRLIEREALNLERPDESALAQTYDRLKELHGKAYDWDPPEIATATASMTRRMRSYIRRWVNEWDLKRLYPGEVLTIDEEPEMRTTYEEDVLLEQTPEAAE